MTALTVVRCDVRADDTGAALACRFGARELGIVLSFTEHPRMTIAVEHGEPLTDAEYREVEGLIAESLAGEERGA